MWYDNNYYYYIGRVIQIMINYCAYSDGVIRTLPRQTRPPNVVFNGDANVFNAKPIISRVDATQYWNNSLNWKYYTERL